MEEVRVLVVEDELVVSMTICDMLEELGYEVLDPVSNYHEAIDQLRLEEPDIVLLDIQIDGPKTGIDLAHFIKDNFGIPFIFLTSQSDKRTVNAAKELNPPAYLLKPFVKEDLYTSIEIALNNFRNTIEVDQKKSINDIIIKDSFFVKSNNMYYKVKFGDITHAKSDHVYVEIFTKNGERHIIRSSMGNFCEAMPDNFYRIHRSYAINLDYLEAINSLYVLIGEDKIPVGTNYRQQLLQKIEIK